MFIILFLNDYLISYNALRIFFFLINVQFQVNINNKTIDMKKLMYLVAVK